MFILIRIFVIGLFVLVAACGDDGPGIQEACGNCPEGLVFDACVEAYDACGGVPTRLARNICFDQLGSTCDSVTE